MAPLSRRCNRSRARLPATLMASGFWLKVERRTELDSRQLSASPDPNRPQRAQIRARSPLLGLQRLQPRASARSASEFELERERKAGRADANPDQTKLATIDCVSLWRVSKFVARSHSQMFKMDAQNEICVHDLMFAVRLVSLRRRTRQRVHARGPTAASSSRPRRRPAGRAERPIVGRRRSPLPIDSFVLSFESRASFAPHSAHNFRFSDRVARSPAGESVAQSFPLPAPPRALQPADRTSQPTEPAGQLHRPTDQPARPVADLENERPLSRKSWPPVGESLPPRPAPRS